MKNKLLIILITLLQGVTLLAQQKQIVTKGDPITINPTSKSISKKDVDFTNHLGTGEINVKGDITCIANNILNRRNHTIAAETSYNGFEAKVDLVTDYTHGVSDSNTSIVKKSTNP